MSANTIIHSVIIGLRVPIYILVTWDSSEPGGGDGVSAEGGVEGGKAPPTEGGDGGGAGEPLPPGARGIEGMNDPGGDGANIPGARPKPLGGDGGSMLGGRTTPCKNADRCVEACRSDQR